MGIVDFFVTTSRYTSGKSWTSLLEITTTILRLGTSTTFLHCKKKTGTTFSSSCLIHAAGDVQVELSAPLVFEEVTWSQKDGAGPLTAVAVQLSWLNEFSESHPSQIAKQTSFQVLSLWYSTLRTSIFDTEIGKHKNIGYSCRKTFVHYKTLLTSPPQPKKRKTTTKNMFSTSLTVTRLICPFHVPKA